jgi:hypothetical protein
MNSNGTLAAPGSGQPGTARSQWLVPGIALAAALSAITGIVSYKHGLDVARSTGNAGLVAYLIPLVPDLMIAMSSVTLIEASRRRSRPPTAMVALAAGVGWTVAQNIAGGWHGGPGGRLIAAGIPLALVATFESLLWLIRHARTAVPEPLASHLQPAPPLSAEAALAALVQSASERQLAELLDVSRSRVQSWKRQLAEPVAETIPEPSPNGAHAGA